MRIDAPSTGHNIAGRSGSPVGSISMAPKPPVSASSIACSINVRKLSVEFGSSSVRRSARSLRSTYPTSPASKPRRTRTCQSMAAMRSLMTLIARRTTGVSANRRRFTGVGLGRCRPGNCIGLRIAGSASVLRSASAAAANSAAPDFTPRPSRSTPRACRHISRNCSPTFTCTFLVSKLVSKLRPNLVPKLCLENKRAQPSGHALCESPKRPVAGSPPRAQRSINGIEPPEISQQIRSYREAGKLYANSRNFFLRPPKSF